MFNGKIINICNQKLIFLNYSANTRQIYIHYMTKFIESSNKQIIHLNAKDFQNSRWSWSLGQQWDDIE